jgi:NADH-quinone oxidoreductase subunit L
LAAGSLLVGFFGTPPILGLGPNRFEEWMAPVFASATAGAAGHAASLGHEVVSEAGHAAAAQAEHAIHNPALEWGLMLASLALAVGAVLISWRIYTRKPEVPERTAASFGGLYRLVRDKYRLDEAYDATIVRPLVVGSRRLLFGLIDARVIDGLVNFLGVLTRIFGNFVAFVQTGQVQAYALLLLAGVVLMLFAVR